MKVKIFALLLTGVLLIGLCSIRAWAYQSLVSKVIEKRVKDEVEELFIYQDMNVPDIDSAFKALMGFHMITDTTSKQWDIQQQAYTDSKGFRRLGIYYLVAMGTYYSQECGDRFRITLDNGNIFYVMTGDLKRDRDTNETNQYGNSGNILEFIVDVDEITYRTKKITGCISDTNEKWEGNIVKIEKMTLKEETNEEI